MRVEIKLGGPGREVGAGLGLGMTLSDVGIRTITIPIIRGLDPELPISGAYDPIGKTTTPKSAIRVFVGNSAPARGTK